MKKGKKVTDLYLLRRKIQREKRDLRKKALGIQDDHTDTSMQRNYGIATKTKRALKVELFGSKSKASATKGQETSIEAFVREILKECDIKFIEQKAISFINVDFFLPEQKIVIQTHGDYWHCNPKVYPDGPKNNMQRKNIEKDKQSDAIVQEHGYKQIKIWEFDIKTDPELTKENLLKEIYYESKD